jgi:hypothetical protein
MAAAHPEHGLSPPDWGKYHRAVKCLPDSKEVAALRESVEQLSR